LRPAFQPFDRLVQEAGEQLLGTENTVRVPGAISRQQIDGRVGVEIFHVPFELGSQMVHRPQRHWDDDQIFQTWRAGSVSDRSKPRQIKSYSGRLRSRLAENMPSTIGSHLLK
jgi:hypothetical protein